MRARSIRHFAGDRRGAAALEFALVMLPFLMCVFFILNVGVQLFLQTTLDAATASAARQVRLGLKSTDTAIRSAICSQLSGLVPSPCTGLKIYVASGATFGALSPATITGGTLSKTGVTPGSLGDTVLMQVAYQATSAASFMPINLTVLSTAIFVNEP